MNEIAPRSQVTKNGVKAVGAIAGGVALIVLAAGSLFAIVAGVVLTVAGLALSSSKSDRTAGIVTTVVGVAALATGILGRWIPGIPWLMRLAGIVFVGVGIYSLVTFFRGMKTRT
jgi:glucose dehydrogenase